MKIRLRVVALAVAVYGPVSAASAAPEPAGVTRVNGPAPVAPAEPPIDVLDLTPAELPGRVGPACDPEPEHPPGGWFASGDYLLWRARRSDAAYVLVDPRRDLTPQGTVLSATPGGGGGLRVGGGYRLPRTGWDVGLTYTYFHGADEFAAAAPAGGLLYPQLTRPGLADQALRAAATADIDYHVFDLDAGRTIIADPHLSVRLFGGVRFASFDAGLRAGYDGLLSRSVGVATRSRFDGAGPTAGAEGRLAVGRGLSLLAGARGGLLYGTFRGDLRETAAGGLTVNADVADRSVGVAPVASVHLGASWEWGAWRVAAGYEVTHWFNALTRPVPHDDFAVGSLLRRQSDLSFDGVFFRIARAY